MNEDSNFIQLLVTELSKLIKLAVEKLSAPVLKAGSSGSFSNLTALKWPINYKMSEIQKVSEVFKLNLKLLPA
jgi:hypothetical protein